MPRMVNFADPSSRARFYPGASFSPADIAGLQLWLDASDESTITASSGAVSQWDDKSGLGRHATQGVGAEQPATGVATYAGRNAIRFASDWMGIPTLDHRLAAIHVFMVYKRNGSDANAFDNFTVPLGGSVNGEGAGSRWNLWYGDEPSFVFQNRQGGNVTHVRNDALNIHEGRGTATELGYRLNGGAEEVRDITGSTQLNTAGTVRLGSGGADEGIYKFVGDMCELVIYTSPLSASDSGAARNYLAAKWAVTLA